MKDPATWVQPHIAKLEPYQSAREMYRGGERILLDANESPFSPAEVELPKQLNRYPDPRCEDLRGELARWLGVEPEKLWLGNGSDEAIDLLLRAFVGPGGGVIIPQPTYGMYAISACASSAVPLEVELDDQFDLDLDAVLDRTTSEAKLVFLCSPNNPTGNTLSRSRVERLLSEFDGPVVLDEAYVEFSSTGSLVPLTVEHRNLIILRTMSKAWGLAGARVGYAIADSLVIDILDRINLPYPLNTLSSSAARQAVSRAAEMESRVQRTVRERERLAARLRDLNCVVFSSDANFLLVRVPAARELSRRLAEDFGIVVRDRSDLPKLENCLRITVGEARENDQLCQAMEVLLT